MNIDLLLEKAKPWATPCGSCDYGMPMGCTCPDGDPRPVMSRLVAEIERLRAVVDAARAWRNGDDVQQIGVDEIGVALVEAVDALDAEAGAR